MFELLTKILALIPAGHELYGAIAELLKDLCARVTAAEESSRETREMFMARADQVGELITRLAQLENTERIPQLANEIKDVRITTLEDTIGRLAARLEAFEREPDVKFTRVDLGDAPANELAAADDAPTAPPLEQRPCPEHPDAPMTPNGCTGEGCTWSGIDRAA